MAIPQRIRDYLDSRNVPYEALHHSQAFTAQEVAHSLHVSGKRCIKAVVARRDNKPVILVMPSFTPAELSGTQVSPEGRSCGASGRMRTGRAFSRLRSWRCTPIRQSLRDGRLGGPSSGKRREPFGLRGNPRRLHPDALLGLRKVNPTALGSLFRSGNSRSSLTVCMMLRRECDSLRAVIRHGRSFVALRCWPH